MDWGSFIGPAVVAAGVSGAISVVGLIVSTRTARGIHSEKLAFDRDLAERKFEFDKDMAERKFKFDRELHDHKRRTELAEQALTAFYEARDVFVWVRTRGMFAGEGSSRTPAVEESSTQQEKRNTYFIPIERLTHQKELFAKLQTLRYAFAAQFDEAATEPFKAILGAHNEIRSAASLLIQITQGEDSSGLFAHDAPPLLDILGWGIAHRPDDIDLKIDKAVEDIEKLCRPALSGAPLK
jgi:hypothetical protein